jgi:replicative DNA helicase
MTTSTRCVYFTYRQETPYDSGGDGIAEITIGKQRNGMTGNFQLSFRKRITKFSDLQKECY